MYLPIFLRSELQELNKKMIFLFNSMEFSGDFNITNVIHESLNGTEKSLWKKSKNYRSE